MSFQEEPFKSLNREGLKKKKTLRLQLDAKKLQVKHNNIKQQWRKLRDRQKHGSGLAPTKYRDWFEIINPVLSDTNQTMDNNCSHLKDLSMITENDRDDDDDETESEYEESLSDLAPAMQSYSSTEVVPETEVVPDRQIEMNVPDSDIIPETQIVLKTQEETRNASAKNIVPKPHEKRTVARSQLQAMSQLASGVNILTKVNAKRMKLEEKNRKALLEFRKEEAEKNRQQEKEMTQIYLQMIDKQCQPQPVVPYQQLQPVAFGNVISPFSRPTSLQFDPIS